MNETYPENPQEDLICECGRHLPCRHCEHDTDPLPDVCEALRDRDWCRYALLVSGAPEIDLPGRAHFAMREIAIAAIRRLEFEEQKTHLQAITDYAINAERDIER